MRELLSSSFRSGGSSISSGAGSGTGSSSSSITSSVGGTGSSVSGFRGSGNGITGSVGSISSSGINGFFGSFFSILRAGRESENASGGGSSENDLAHEWYSLNSEWTTHGKQPRGKPTLRVDFARQLVALSQRCKR